MWVARAGIHKMLVRTANRETLIRLLIQMQPGLSLLCLSRPFKQATSVRNFRTFTIQLLTLLYFKYLSNRMRFLNSCGELRHRYLNVNLDNLCSSHIFKIFLTYGYRSKSFQSHLLFILLFFRSYLLSKWRHSPMFYTQTATVN